MNIKKMSIGLLAVLLTVPAFAQAQQDSIRNDFMKRKDPSVLVKQAKLTSALQMAALMVLFSNEGFVKKTHAIKEKPTFVKSPYKKDSLPTCVYCGETFNPALNEHCSATGNTGLHSASAPQNVGDGSSAPASVCPKCHQTLSVDERFHGVPHNCPADTASSAASLPTCVYCGEQFNPTDHEHCAATGYTGLHAVASSQNDNKGASSPVRRCPECGKELTLDEIYHNTHTHYCIKCGKEFEGRSNPDCSVSGKCTIQCPDCGMNLRDEQNLINGTHHCKFKGRYTPVAPVK